MAKFTVRSKVGLTRGLTVLALSCVVAVGWSAPRTPSDAGEVLERLAVKAGDPDASRLKQYQQAVSRAPKDAQAVADLARLYFDLAMAHGNPRYVGYADALISGYPGQLSAELLFIRGLLRQYRHAFEEAKVDLRAALAAQPDFAEAHGWLGAIALVQADYVGAGQACTALGAAGAPTLQAGCLGLTLAYTGQLAQGYEALEKGLARADDPGNRLWLLTRMAEIAAWQGRAALAERHYKSALRLGLTDGYLLAAWSDFLLDQQRPQEVMALLAGKEASDPLLLRLALAHQQTGSLKAPTLVKMLDERFAATRLRGDTTHRAEEARYALQLRRDIGAALALAQANYEVQREPRDARILLEAALAAGQRVPAQKVEAWMKSSGFQGVPLSQQLALLAALPKGNP
jgi:Tfp pilus assembly protein PilF